MGVGSGSFLAGFNLITTQDVRSVTIGDTVFKGATSVILDFRPPAPPEAPGVPGPPADPAHPFDSPAIIAANSTSSVSPLTFGLSAFSSLTSLQTVLTSGYSGDLTGRQSAADRLAASASEGGGVPQDSTTTEIQRLILAEDVKSIVNLLLNQTKSGAGAALTTAGRKLLGLPSIDLESLETLLDDFFLIKRPAAPAEPSPEAPMSPQDQSSETDISSREMDEPTMPEGESTRPAEGPTPAPSAEAVVIPVNGECAGRSSEASANGKRNAFGVDPALAAMNTNMRARCAHPPMEETARTPSERFPCPAICLHPLRTGVE